MTIHIFQLHYNRATKDLLDPGFIPLEIPGNPRPDWREYWAMRQYFLKTSMNEDDYYGFLSPLFKSKTCLDSEKVFSFIADNPGGDVYTFSPTIQDAACYLNVFEHGNRCHPGMIPVMQDFLDLLGITVDFSTFVNDFRSSVYCNYVIAKPVFWEKWFVITERLFDLAENLDGPLSKKLNDVTDYHKAPLAMKVFIIERVASLLLGLMPDLKVFSFDIRAMPWQENANYFAYRDEMMLLNALKIAYTDSWEPEYLDIFFSMRNKVLMHCDTTYENGPHNHYFQTEKEIGSARLKNKKAGQSIPLNVLGAQSDTIKNSVST